MASIRPKARLVAMRVRTKPETECPSGTHLTRKRALSGRYSRIPHLHGCSRFR